MHNSQAKQYAYNNHKHCILNSIMYGKQTREVGCVY